MKITIEPEGDETHTKKVIEGVHSFVVLGYLIHRKLLPGHFCHILSTDVTVHDLIGSCMAAQERLRDILARNNVALH